ncbi:hypothetical protein GDO81_023292 [Engystomops pustulosus]|uniref:Uncharacterized protein n=1 Tax=Engystomops pustulosus TaxID=76066 RepID=A0AAV6YLN7_ENGPU|nr:hypothetical protein GDO81_023292 [Engystomops pustulosus]
MRHCPSSEDEPHSYGKLRAQLWVKTIQSLPPLFSWKAARPCLSVQKDRSTSLPSTLIDFSPLLRASRRRLCKTLFPEPGDKELTPLAPAVTPA